MKKIIHVDMDCFYAAVETKYNPSLKGKALGIGGPPDSRSVLCTASYEARKYGVRSAMPSSQAVRLCPHLILLPPNFDLYKKESRAVRAILERFTSQIEPLSLDEAYLDVSDCQLHGGSATLIAQDIRRCIEKELHLTASAGVAPNKFLAKIASDWNKPNGLFVIRPSDVEAFMPPLKVEKIFGVGKVTAKKMHELGLKTCGDIQKQSSQQLSQWFGSRGPELYDLAHGIDTRPVDTSWERKSLTVEETYDRDLASFEEWRSRLPSLFEELERRLEKSDYSSRIRGFVVKVKYHDFKGTTHETASRQRPELRDFHQLLQHIWDRRSDPVRLIGLGVRMGTLSEKKAFSDRGPQLSFSLVSS